MNLVAGARLGPYEILSPLGAGGMGEVFRARDTRLDREVALKLLPGAFAQDKARLARFRKEAHVLASLNHPSIAAIHGLEEMDGVVALALELVEGEDLALRLKRGAIPAEEAIAIAKQIAEGLEAAHEKGIVHRDLKPANVKLARDGAVKLLDFGLAKALEGETTDEADLSQSPTLSRQMTEAGIILGTAAYMSPEQARGKPVDERADVWSFGVVLYEMLAGKRLFHGATVSDTLAAVLKTDLDWTSLPRDLHPAIRYLLRRCLEREPRQRLHGIGEARVILEGTAEAALSVAAHASTARAPRWRRTLPWVLSAAAGLAAAGLALRPPTEPPAAPPRVRTLTYSGTDSMPSSSPDGRLIAFVSDRDGRDRIWLKQLDTGGEQALTEGYDSAPRFSPDGASVLFMRGEGERQSVYRQSIVGGEARKIADDALEACWSPDGARVALVRLLHDGAGVALAVTEVQTGLERELARSEQQLYRLQWSPAGDVISVVEAPLAGSGLDLTRIALFPVAGGVPHRISVPGPDVLDHAWNGVGRQVVFVQAGSPSVDYQDPLARVVLLDLDTGRERTLAFAEHLFPNRGFLNAGTTLSIVADGTLALDSVLGRQRLREQEVRNGVALPPGRLLTQGQALDRQPTYSPDGRQVLFTSNRSGNSDLWLLDLESGRLRQVTDDREQDWDPAFTPDGRGALWSSRRGGSEEIWTATTDGSGARQLSRDGRNVQNPVSSPDGRFVVYWSGNPEKKGVWRMRADGAEATRIVPGPYFQTTVSPDGRWAGFLLQEPHKLRTLIRVADLESGRLLPFEVSVASRSNREEPIILGRHRWMSGARAIAFVGLDKEGRSGVFVQDFDPNKDTRASRRKLAGFDPVLLTESFAIAPDGSRIVLSEMEVTRKLLLVEGVAGVVRPRVGSGR